MCTNENRGGMEAEKFNLEIKGSTISKTTYQDLDCVPSFESQNKCELDHLNLPTKLIEEYLEWSFLFKFWLRKFNYIS